MSLYDDAISWMKRQAEGEGFQNRRQMALHLKADPTQLNYTLDFKRTPGGEKLMQWLERLGARLVFPDEEQTTRQVCFVAPKTLAGSDGVPGPTPEDYLAVPLAGAPVAAGRGLIPDDEIRSWVLVWRHHESVRFRSDLVAVEIGPGERSMVPTLHPGDVVLVDRNDRDPVPAGKIMLVSEPSDVGGGVAVKRVRTKELKDDIELIYYSDNAREYAPDTYRLSRDFQGDISRAINGRVVWAWTDVTKK